MIRINGQATLKVDFDTTIPMTQEAFDALSERKQNEILDNHIDWHSTMQNAEADDFDIYDVIETKEETK